MVLLQLENITVFKEGKRLLSECSLTVDQGQRYVILGKNGAGKSTLSKVIMGEDGFQITGTVKYAGEDISKLSIFERAKKGLFLVFQNPIELEGMTYLYFLKLSLEQLSNQKYTMVQVKDLVKPLLAKVGLTEQFLQREFHKGFSGGEKKRSELLQVLLFKPRLIIFDEIDSGLDMNAINTFTKILREYQDQTKATFIIISHNAEFISQMSPTKIGVLSEGKIIREGGLELVKEFIQA